MSDGISRRDPLRMVNREHLSQQVEAILIDKVLILDSDELVPVFLRKIKQILLEVVAELDVIHLFDICSNIVSSNHLSYANELVIVVASFEKRFFGEHHSC